VYKRNTPRSGHACPQTHAFLRESVLSQIGSEFMWLEDLKGFDIWENRYQVILVSSRKMYARARARVCIQRIFFHGKEKRFKHDLNEFNYSGAVIFRII